MNLGLRKFSQVLIHRFMVVGHIARLENRSAGRWNFPNNNVSLLQSSQNLGIKYGFNLDWIIIAGYKRLLFQISAEMILADGFYEFDDDIDYIPFIECHVARERFYKRNISKATWFKWKAYSSNFMDVEFVVKH
jgi:hypothetical protein